MVMIPLSVVIQMGEIFKRTARLFARPSFEEGVARVMDLGATLNIYNIDETPEEADAKAIYSDWAAVGDDIIYSISKYQPKP